MILTAEQIKALEPYEQYFTTAILSKYARYPGSHGVHLIHQIYTAATKRAIRLNSSCSTCIFRLLVDCGTLYFKDKEELEKSREVKTDKHKRGRKRN